MSTALDPLSRAVAQIDDRAVELLEWCAAQFNRHYGSAGIVVRREQSWALPIGTGSGHLVVQFDHDTEDNDGGIARLSFRATGEREQFYAATVPWFPVVHVDRAWADFAEMVNASYLAEAIIALIRATFCTSCGWQEHTCHNQKTLATGTGAPCCARCSHPLIIRRTP